MNSKKLKVKDIITVTLLSLINIIIFSAGTFLYATPLTVLLMPVFYSLLQGIVFFMIGVKVKKRGAMFLYCVIQGVMGMYIPYIILYVIAGVITEFIMKRTGYANVKGLAISYVLLQLLACLGSTVYPYTIALKTTIEGMSNTGNLSEVIVQASEMISSWGLFILLLGVAVAAACGALIGKRVVKKHLMSEEAVA